MKALILVGGFGTRLRPLTFSVPKPLVEFGNMAIVVHQIEALAKVGVNEVVLAVSSAQPQVMDDHMKAVELKYKVKVTYSVEDTPMGTAGPIRLAQHILLNNNHQGLFFVLNSDVTCDFPLQEMLHFHRSHNKQATILLTKVADPSKYGVVLHAPDGQVQDFIEKPQEFISDKINAGLYILNTEVIERIPMKPTSIEREVFPLLAKDQQLFCFTLQGFWMDIGQPKDYLEGQRLYLEYQREHPGEVKLREESEEIIGNVLVDESAVVEQGAVLGPNVVVGKGVVIKTGARLQNCTILPDTLVDKHSYIQGSIIGWQNKIGKWTRVQGLTVTGKDVTLKDTLFINQTMICPHKTISTSIDQPDKIII